MPVQNQAFKTLKLIITQGIHEFSHDKVIDHVTSKPWFKSQTRSDQQSAYTAFFSQVLSQDQYFCHSWYIPDTIVLTDTRPSTKWKLPN